MELCQGKTRVIIAGSREFTDQYRLNKVCNWIFAYKKLAYTDVEIESGTCRGADEKVRTLQVFTVFL